MSSFIKFDDALINTKHIICLFPSEYEEGAEYKGKWYKIYKIVMRLTNGGMFEEKFNMKENRDNRFNELQNCLL